MLKSMANIPKYFMKSLWGKNIFFVLKKGYGPIVQNAKNRRKVKGS